MKKVVGIHDVLRDLCIRENRRENTFRIAKVFVGELMVERERDLEKRNICSLCGEREVLVDICFPLISRSGYIHSVINPVCVICQMKCPALNTLRSVVIIRQKRRKIGPVTTKLRYLHVRWSYYRLYTTWLHLFWNLRSIVFYSSRAGVINLPSEIWNMPQLRHVNFNKAILPEPPVTPIDGKDSIILEGLESLGYLVDFSCSEEIVARIPNVKTLKIGYVNRDRDISYFEYHNLTRLHKLESLTINWANPYFVDLRRAMKEFPRSLKKLTLDFCAFSWEDMTIIGSLPNLEVLKLKTGAFRGERWNPIEGEFLQLKKLSIHGLYDLVTWDAEKDHFPKLESLVLSDMYNLKNFPSGIGEIDMLLSITLCDCSYELVNSAKEVVAEQQTYGNMGLQLYVVKK